MRWVVVAALVSAFAAPAQAVVVDFVVKGTLASVEYDYGGPASATFLADIPFGSAYAFTYSYDTAATPVSGGPQGAGYYLPLGGTFSIGGTDFTIPIGNVFTGRNFGGSVYGVFGNGGLGVFLPNSFYLLDMTMTLTDPTGTVLTTPALPTSIDLADFPTRRMRVRFGGNAGETGLLFTIDSIANVGAGVPEPGAWALFIAGFGLTGTALRRRRIARLA